ncbi:MAG: 4-phosphoerythronate dehydrogenase [Ignavibacteriae bacterium]|nr:4-phosphoerythronate dehydrogenase [Ignavibacteriota bacterium]NOG99239.1 4-phosphoerythronate dehydrogenase [Ignavibacteriota bacterium]
MKIIVDENIEFGVKAFSEFGEVISLNGREITNSILKDSDALIVRSITNVDEKLLSGTDIKFVGTATIGTDHVDTEYLSDSKIIFADAKGCNANAVKEYVLTAILSAAVKNNIQLRGKTIGVIGAGSIGLIVAEAAEILGMTVVKNDPPLKRETGSDEYKSLDEALFCDIVTFHTPLNLEGIDKTFHLVNSSNIDRLKNCEILINSSRGPVIDNLVLTKFLTSKQKPFTILDVWEDEPNLNDELLGLTDIASPHVAGYTLEGKVNGTKLIYDQFCKFLKIKPTWKPILPKVENSVIEANTNESVESVLNSIFTKIYQIENDTKQLKVSLNLSQKERGKYFDELRKKYKLRREFSNYSIKLKPFDETIAGILKSLNFEIII